MKNKNKTPPPTTPTVMKMKSLLLLTGIASLASVTFPGTAHAALIYSGVQNVAVPLSGIDGTYLRISDGTVSGTLPANYDTEPWLNPVFGGSWIYNSPLLRPVITGIDQIVNLAAGTVINAGGNFVGDASASTSHVGPAANQFQIGTPGYLGFVFETSVGGPDYYGWAQVIINNAGAGSIVDWAYDNTAGTSIMAGQIAPVPEPAAIAIGLLCLGAGSIRRRRATAAQVTV